MDLPEGGSSLVSDGVSRLTVADCERRNNTTAEVFLKFDAKPDTALTSQSRHRWELCVQTPVPRFARSLSSKGPDTPRDAPAPRYAYWIDTQGPFTWKPDVCALSSPGSHHTVHPGWAAAPVKWSRHPPVTKSAAPHSPRVVTPDIGLSISKSSFPSDRHLGILGDKRTGQARRPVGCHGLALVGNLPFKRNHGGPPLGWGREWTLCPSQPLASSYTRLLSRPYLLETNGKISNMFWSVLAFAALAEALPQFGGGSGGLAMLRFGCSQAVIERIDP